jgi:hypothetical protein
MAGRLSMLGLCAALTVALASGACGSSAGASADAGVDGAPLRDATVSKDAPRMLGNGGDAAEVFNVTPTGLTTLTVKAGSTTPTAKFSATVNGGPSAAVWSVDVGEIGRIAAGPSTSATFVPTGTTGGLVTLTARDGADSATRQILVKLTSQQSGPTSAEASQVPTMVSQLSAGGGVGGVGGEGLGPAVTDPAALHALDNPSSASQGLTLLYPYDKTVWPRGMLAPLLMWSWTPGDADAIKIDLATGSGSFSWSGTFGRPAILAMTGGKYIRSPIPQDVWDMATNTAGALTTSGAPDPLIMKLTVEKGGVGAGPVSQTWPVAPGRLTGTVYYNSYGTHFVKNWANADGAGHPVGAAVLGIRSGATSPTLVVGENSPLGSNGIPTSDVGCRVCHVVSSRGRWIITQSEQGSPGDGQSYLYDLTSSNVQGTDLMVSQQGTFAWAAMTSDGTRALTNSIDPSSTNPSLNNAAGGTATSSLWTFAPTPGPVGAPPMGLPTGVAAGYPSYSPDDKLVAYIDVTGHTQNFGDLDGGSSVTGVMMTAKYDSTTQAFSDVRTVASPSGGQRIGYPVFLPDDSGLLFETEVRPSQTDSVMVTRNGARSELWWVKLGQKPVRLDTLNGKANGKSYLPTNINDHGQTGGPSDPRSSYSEVGWDDTTLSYEPTVLPLVAGGYAWVVFTSRRLYGSQLTAVPWQSWPTDYDTTNLAIATVKKLWVAAIDLNAPADADVSHPAFYLPAQEILAGNSRGFWVLNPCSNDGTGCQTGDECCSGYCEASGDAAALTCTSVARACSAVQEKCTTSSNCCDTTNQCIAGFCAVQATK